MAESESQKRYNKKYQRTHKSKQDYYRGKSATKKFILKQATDKDLDLVQKMINKRRDN